MKLYVWYKHHGTRVHPIIVLCIFQFPTINNTKLAVVQTSVVGVTPVTFNVVSSNFDNSFQNILFFIHLFHIRKQHVHHAKYVFDFWFGGVKWWTIGAWSHACEIRVGSRSLTYLRILYKTFYMSIITNI